MGQSEGGRVIVQLRAEIALVHMYTCSVCGAKERGSTLRVEYAGLPCDLQAFVEAQPMQSSRMPIGWSYNGAFKCAKDTQ